MSITTQNEVTRVYLAESQQTETTSSTTSSQTLGKDQFLKLLIAQMEYQDPLNPMEGTEFTAQLAQFTSLEQLYNVNTALGTLNDSVTAQNRYQATDLIGRQIWATGETLAVEDGQVVVGGGYELASAADEVQIIIYDQDGEVVESKIFQNQDAGYYDLSWDGTDTQGNAVSDGAYTFEIEASTSDGQTVAVTRFMTGAVSGLTQGTDGDLLLLLSGLGVSLSSVVEVGTVQQLNQEE